MPTTLPIKRTDRYRIEVAFATGVALPTFAAMLLEHVLNASSSMVDLFASMM